MKDWKFDGMVALVTGAGNGLGRQHALELARRGAKVMVNDIALDKDRSPISQRFAEELRQQGFEAASNTGSVGAEAEARAMVEQTVRQFGKIDILINNAGYAKGGAIQDVSTADLTTTLEGHLYSTFWTMSAALPHMRAQNYGRIVNTASSLGAFGAPKSIPYVTAKAAIIGLSKGAALDNQDKDIRVNILSPTAYTQMSRGYFDTQPQIKLDKLHVSRVSPVVLFLAHRDCPLNGEIISAGAGRVARIFTATGPGYKSDSLTCEDVAENLETILDTSDFSILKSSIEQYKFMPL